MKMTTNDRFSHEYILPKVGCFLSIIIQTENWDNKATDTRVNAADTKIKVSRGFVVFLFSQADGEREGGGGATKGKGGLLPQGWPI